MGDQLSALLDTPAEQVFDRITRLLSKVLGTPVSLVSLIDRGAERQFFKSQYGLVEPWSSKRETPLTHSFCQHVVDSDGIFIVENALTDPRVANNKAVPELGVAAYLGVPVRDADGVPIGALCAIDSKPRHWTTDEIAAIDDLADIINRELALRHALARRADAEARFGERDLDFRVLAGGMPQLAWMADHTGSVFWYNDRWYNYTGTTYSEMAGWGWQSVHDPVHVDHVVESYKRSIETGDPWEDTFPLRGADGAYRWFLSRALPVRDPTGRITRWFGTNTDITQQREREAHVDFLMREVSHRAKNMLAVVQAMARQTGRSSTSVEDFQKRFSSRIHALASSHDLLVDQNWMGVPLLDLVRSQMSPFLDLKTNLIHISGPEVVLTAETSQPIGLALHELATNASKHGALSTLGGEVAVTWSMIDDGVNAGGLSVSWIESGGPLVTPPTRKGFGHTVIEKMLAAALNCTAVLEFRPEGVVWQAVLPASAVSKLTMLSPVPAKSFTFSPNVGSPISGSRITGG